MVGSTHTQCVQGPEFDRRHHVLHPWYLTCFEKGKLRPRKVILPRCERKKMSLVQERWVVMVVVLELPLNMVFCHPHHC